MKGINYEVPWFLSPQALRKKTTGKTLALEDFVSETNGDINIISVVKMWKLGSVWTFQYGLKMVAKAKEKPLLGNFLDYWELRAERHIMEYQSEVELIADLNNYAVKRQKDLKASFNRDVYITYAKSFVDG